MSKQKTNSAAKATKKATKPAKAPAAAKRAKKPAKSAAREDGIFIAPAAADATEATEAPKSAKPAAKAKKATKARAAKPAAKPTKEKKPAAVRPDFTPAKLPAVFHSPDGSGELTITAASITYFHGLREVIFPARSAHYFARDYKAGERVIAAGSVGVKLGGKSLVIGPEAPAIVAAVRTAKAEADRAAKAAKEEGGAK